MTVELLGKYYIDKLPGSKRKMPRPPGNNSPCYKYIPTVIPTSYSILPVHQSSAISSQASVEVAARTPGLWDSASGPRVKSRFFHFQEQRYRNKFISISYSIVQFFSLKDNNYEEAQAFADNLHILIARKMSVCCHCVP